MISEKFRKIAQNCGNWAKLTHKRLIFMCVVLLPPEFPAKFQRVLIAKNAEKLQQQKMLKISKICQKSL